MEFPLTGLQGPVRSAIATFSVQTKLAVHDKHYSLYAYPTDGNGRLDEDDYFKTQGDALHAFAGADLPPAGSVLDVDVTTAVNTALSNGWSYLGLVWKQTPERTTHHSLLTLEAEEPHAPLLDSAQDEQPILRSIASGAETEISWRAIAGLTYAVEWTASPDAADWAEAFRGQAARHLVQWVDTPSYGRRHPSVVSQRYYRIRLIPSP